MLNGPMAEMTGPRGRTIVLYDGVCGLCDRLIRFLLARDRRDRMRFAPLQSEFARRVLARYGRDASDLNTVYVIADWEGPQERVLARSRAILHALSKLGGVWGLVARAALWVPVPLADVAYRVVSRIRYRLFGHFDACPLPPPHWRERFMDECD